MTEADLAASLDLKALLEAYEPRRCISASARRVAGAWGPTQRRRWSRACASSCRPAFRSPWPASAIRSDDALAALARKVH